MTQEKTSPPQEFPEFACGIIVYRALLRKRWIDKKTQKLQSAAFMRRPKSTGKDLTGISVNPKATCSIQSILKKFNCFGVVTLHVGSVRDIGLDVEPDSPIHANITGLPDLEDDPVEAERLAGLLAKQARIEWLPE